MSRTSRQERWKRGQANDGNFGTSSALGVHLVVILFRMPCGLSVSSVLIQVCVFVCACVGHTWHVLADLKLIFLFDCLERDFGAL